MYLGRRSQQEFASKSNGVTHLLNLEEGGHGHALVVVVLELEKILMRSRRTLCLFVEAAATPAIAKVASNARIANHVPLVKPRFLSEPGC
jgi:hypothetical protein